MSSPEPTSELRRLVREAEFAIDHLDSTLLFEPWLIRIVEFIRAHPESREGFLEQVIEWIRDGACAYEVLEYSMACLRWPEVLEVVELQLAQSDDLRTAATLRAIAAAYTEEWESADLYESFNTVRCDRNV